MKMFFVIITYLIIAQSNAQDSLKIKNDQDSVSKKVNPDGPFIKVQVESHYPSGNVGWAKFLYANLQYPKKALRKKIQGTVVIQFIVDKDGSVSNVQAVSGPETGGLREEAIRVITISGKWAPAVQNGRAVRSQKKQPIEFKLD